MSHRTIAAAAVAAAAALALAGCAAGKAQHPATTAKTSQGAGETRRHYAVVPASESRGVVVTKLPKRRQGNAVISSGTNGLPKNHFVAGKPTKVTLHYYAGNRSRSPVGLTVTATHGALRCGAPFLATYGHAYAITCTFEARKGHTTVSLEELDPRTGRPSGTRGTYPVPAR
jgi:hypothetical protein